MNDRELLEMAAKAAGVSAYWSTDGTIQARPLFVVSVISATGEMPYEEEWNPQKNRAQALELAVQLKINITHDNYEDFELSVSAKIKTPAGFWDSYIFTEEVLQEAHRLNVTCRVIVHAAAAIGEAL